MNKTAVDIRRSISSMRNESDLLNKSLRTNLKNHDYRNAELIEKKLQRIKVNEERLVLRQIALAQEKEVEHMENKLKTGYDIFTTSQMKQKDHLLKKQIKIRDDLAKKQRIEIENYKKDFEYINPKKPDLISELLRRKALMDNYIKTKNFKEASKLENETQAFIAYSEEMFQIQREKRYKSGLKKLIDSHQKERNELEEEMELTKKEKKIERRCSSSRIDTTMSQKIHKMRNVQSSEMNYFKDIFYITNVKNNIKITPSLKKCN